MRKFLIEISFVNKPKTTVEVRGLNPKEALKKVIYDVDRNDRENIIGTQIIGTCL